MKDIDYSGLTNEEMDELYLKGDFDFEHYIMRHITPTNTYLTNSYFRWAFMYGITISTERFIPGMVLRYEIDGAKFSESWDIELIPGKVLDIIKRMRSSKTAKEVEQTARVMLREIAKHSTIAANSVKGGKK